MELSVCDGLQFPGVWWEPEIASPSGVILTRLLARKKKKMARISKIDNFHPIDLKFEQDFHIGSLNKTTNYF